MSYLVRPLPLALIFGSFFAVFVPLALLQLLPNFFDWLPYLIVLQAVGLGTSHFFITLALYFRRSNLTYFASSWRNRLVYFVVPAFIFVLYGVSEVARFHAREPLIAAYVFGGLRLFDFFHVGRQSAGVLQLFKREQPGPAPQKWLRTAENAFFVGMALLQWQTFLLGGRFVSAQLYATLPALAMAALFLIIALTHLQRVIDSPPGSRLRWVSLSHFVMQAVCSAAAVYQTRLYLVALTLHYVEYHVLMAPRCLDVPRDPARPTVVSAETRSRRAWVLYGVLALVVVPFELRNRVPVELPLTTDFLVHAFDGIFLVHYFVEAFVWKFRNPFYRDALAPLYFTPPAPSAPDEVASPLARVNDGLRRAVPVFAALAVVWGLSWATGFTSLLRGHLIDPMHVQNHLRWGIELAQAGDLVEARRHIDSAVARDATNRQAQSVLQWLDQRSQSSSVAR